MKRLLTILLLSLTTSGALAEQTVSLTTWRQIPVLENGRVMPLDSYARQKLLEISGRSTFQRQPAIRWLARVVFTPKKTKDDAIFLVNNPEVVEALGLSAEGRKRYSYAQIEPAIADLERLARAAFHLEAEERSEVDSEIMRLYNSIALYRGLLNRLDFANPQMADAFRNNQQKEFDDAAQKFLDSTHQKITDDATRRKLALEIQYNQSNALYRAELLYGFAFLIALLSVPLNSKWVYRGALGLILLALIPHSYGIVARMIIMGRPPVTNLYATFVFVSWVSVIIGLVVEYFQRNKLGLITSGCMGLVLLLTSGRFGTDNDTMGVMVAVLDSNFWLATHVVAISIGYAGCCVAGLLGHIYLLQALRRKADDPKLMETYNAVYGALAFGLIFSFLGTMLGGIWADQSWGRFWGWDPKENGALVIVLWSAILFHAKIDRTIGPLGFSAGCVIGVIWVLLAWLGVNLLNVGLHSYGFTSGIARGLFFSGLAEILFVLFTLFFIYRKRRSA